VSIKAKIDKQLGHGYYDAILKMGVAAGIPTARLAKEMETTAEDIRLMKLEYRDEISDLMVHRRVADLIYKNIGRARMSKMLMKTMDLLENELSVGGLDPKTLVDLMKFLSKHLDEGRDSREETVGSGPITKEEINERALRLLDEGGDKKPARTRAS